MNRDKILEKIKDLNSLRARLKRDFKEIEKKHLLHEISEKEFGKRESAFIKNYEKLQHEIHELEQSLNE